MALKSFEQTDPDVGAKVIRASLETASDIDGGVLQETPATETWGPFVPDGQWIQWAISAGDQTALESEAHIHLEVESSVINLIPALGGAERLLTLAVGPHKISVGTNAFTVQLDGVYNETFTLIHQNQRLDDGYYTLDVLMTGTSMDVYADGLLITQDTNAISAGDFATITLAASGTGTEKWARDQGFRNFYVYSKHQEITPAKTLNMTVFGDSFPTNGGFPSTHIQSANQDNNGTPAYRDQGTAATIFKTLNTAGYSVDWISHSISGAKVTGATASDLVTQISSASDMTGRIAYVSCGTNDITGGIPGDFKTDYQSRIDELKAKNPDQIWLATVATRVHADPYVSTYEDDVNTANAAIYDLAAENENVYVFDVFTAMGGHSASADLFGTGDAVPHPNLDGFKLIGQTFANSYIASEASAGTVTGTLLTTIL